MSPERSAPQRPAPPQGGMFGRGPMGAIGLPVQTVGFPRVGLNCGLCHVGSVRENATAPRQVLIGAPNSTLDLQRYFRFLFAAAGDERFTPDVLIPAIELRQTVSPIDGLLLRFLVIPQLRSGLLEQKRELLELMDGLAPSFGDDWWFTGHHAFALAENGLHETARTKIERSMARNPTNAYGAHTRAHLCYEAGELVSGQGFLRSWLATYPRDVATAAAGA